MIARLRLCGRIVACAVIPLLAPALASAEGSAELDIADAVTGGAAHDQAVSNDTVVRVDILNGGAEKVCWLGTGTATLRRPDNDAAVGAALAAGTCRAAVAGVTGAYRLQLGSSQVIGIEWDIRVCASSVSDVDCLTMGSNERTGRVWSTSWSFQVNTSFAANRSNNGSVYAIVPGGAAGRDAVIEMQMRGVSGARYRLVANGIGPETSGGVRVGRSVPITGHQVTPLFRLYLNPPESAQYNWLTPEVQSVVLASTCGSGVVLGTALGSVTFETNVTGQYTLICDVNGDDVFDFASPTDFSSFGNAMPGSNAVSWNGRRNDGTDAPAGDYACVIRVNVGEFHYIADDIETSYPGFRMYRVEADRTTRTPIRMFWDDNAVAAGDITMPNGMTGLVTSPAAGLDPGAYAAAAAANTNARAWGNFNASGSTFGDGKGQDAYLDTYASAASQQSNEFTIGVLTAGDDPDDDGLTSAEECTSGTDPELWDTDGDGVSDGGDPEPVDMDVCGDANSDGCDDCAAWRSDTDADGRCDRVDADDDGDGLLDATELGGEDLSIDTDADGVPDFRDPDAVSCEDTAPADGACDALPAEIDEDGDGVPNHLDLDADGDGLSDTREAGGEDANGDGAPDGCSGVDTDGVCSGGALTPVDTDDDGRPDYLDLDSDGDGIEDHDEAFDSDGDGSSDRAPAGADSDGDGIDDAFDPDCAGAGDCGGVIGAALTEPYSAAQDRDGDGVPGWLQRCGDGYRTGAEACDDGNGEDADACSNSCERRVEFGDHDGDGLSDDLDRDDDGDGVTDDDEFGGRDLSVDSDADGIPDYEDADFVDCGDAVTAGACDELPAEVDADRDGVPNHLDSDADGDGVLDRVEGHDDDHDGRADRDPTGEDADGDGLDDAFDPDCDESDSCGGVLGVRAPRPDLDGDGTPDFLDVDDDADDVDTRDELGDGDVPRDTDEDGRPDYLDSDDDGDGIPSREERGDGDTPRDTDDDGMPDYLDPDDDGDGLASREEWGDGETARDTDDDGMPDYLDPDDDGDGLPSSEERGDGETPRDTDDDGTPDYLDPDDDGDGVPSSEERGDGETPRDTDDDGTPDYLDPDDDGDGIPSDEEPEDEDDNGVPDYREPSKSGGKPRPSARREGTLAGGSLCAVRAAGTSADGGVTTFVACLGLGLWLASRRRGRRRRRDPGTRAVVVVVLLLGSSQARPGRAQVAVDQFKPAPLASDGFALSRPDVLRAGGVGLLLVLEYANDPLVYEPTRGDDEDEIRVIEHHFVAHVGGAIGILDRLTAFAVVPVHVVMRGVDDPPEGVAPADGAGLGDLALGGRLLLAGDRTSMGALSAELVARLPTAELADDEQVYSGDAIGSYEPAVVGELRAGRLAVRARVGARLRKPRTVGNLRLDQELVYGLGARLRVVEALYAHAELHGSTYLDSAFAREHSPLEALLGLKYQPDGVQFGAAAGPGLLRGFGSPDVRVVATVGYAPARARADDRDGDGLLDPADRCPRNPEDRDGFEDDDGCPDPDNDRDGILDTADACPREPEDPDGFKDQDGCPEPDNDRDGIADGADRCALEPEDTDAFEDQDGCPDPDNDRDGLLDPQDRCPLEAEDKDEFEDQDGCPEAGKPRVRITCERVDLAETVYFDTNSDRIQERSFELLDQVAQALTSAPHVKRVRVEGHTDSRGGAAANLNLSKRRAASVVRYLTQKGVGSERLQSEGYGEAKPIADNDTEEGRSANRRVEFLIVEQDTSNCAPRG